MYIYNIYCLQNLDSLERLGVRLIYCRDRTACLENPFSKCNSCQGYAPVIITLQSRSPFCLPWGMRYLRVCYSVTCNLFFKKYFSQVEPFVAASFVLDNTQSFHCEYIVLKSLAVMKGENKKAGI